jgi:hypothetical protein
MTALYVILSPRKFFDEMPKSDGYGGPLLFMIMMVVVSIIVMVIMKSLGLGFGGLPEMGTETATGPGVRLGMALVIGASIVIVPLAVAVGSFFWALILHIIWKLMGSEESYETSYRCVAYLTALTPITTALGAAVPYVGSALGVLIMVCYTVIASMEVHEISAFKAGAVFGIIGSVLIVLGIFAEMGVRTLVEEAATLKQQAEEKNLVLQKQAEEAQRQAAQQQAAQQQAQQEAQQQAAQQQAQQEAQQQAAQQQAQQQQAPDQPTNQEVQRTYEEGPPAEEQGGNTQ